MLWARAASSRFLILGTVDAQRGRVPQFVFIKSRTKSAVVLGSTVAGLSSGTGGGFTVDHSVVMSLAPAGRAENAVRPAARTIPEHTHATFFMRSPFGSEE